MTVNLFELLSQNDEFRAYKNIIDDLQIVKITYHKNSKVITLLISAKEVIPFVLYESIKDFLSEKLSLSVDLFFDCENSLTPISNLVLYFFNYVKNNGLQSVYEECLPEYNDGKLNLKFNDEEKSAKAYEHNDVLLSYLSKYGINLQVEYVIRDKTKVIAPEIVYTPRPVSASTPSTSAPVEKKTFKKKGERYSGVRLKDLKEITMDIKFDATVFNLDNRVTKTGKIIQILMVVDDSDAIKAKRFESRNSSKEDMEAVRKGDSFTFYGSYIYDSFSNEYVMQIDKMEACEVKKTSIVDDSPQKRIELHMHSNRSEMDAVSSVEDLVTHAFNLGHEAVALTDHMVVQGFPKAQRTIEQLNKKHGRDFKMIYGVEMNVVDRYFDIVTNGNNSNLSDSDYVVFDIETTGLSNNSDHIIEFAASIVHNDTIVDTIDILIKPPVKIPAFITKLTHIDDEMVKNEKTFEEVCPIILDFIKDLPLVAHNGLFDYDFVNEALKNIGREPLENPLIDTLAMARIYVTGRRSYRLGSLANYFKIEYKDTDAHRADYDVSILVDVYKRLKALAIEKGVKTLNDLQSMQDDDTYMRNFKKHIIVLSKNQKGLKDLFKLVSISHTDNLAVLGKANSKNGEEYLAEPRIIRDVLEQYRDDILIGSACLNGELFELAANKSMEDLKKAMAFYDYIEIQPIENYRPLVERNSVVGYEALKNILRRIIDAATALNKIIVATGDVHYVTPADKVYRDIYINALGIGGSHHPLYIYDATRRANTVNPDQHFRTTHEMIEAFAWLNDEVLIDDLVINNPKKIANKIEVCKPLHDDLKTPIIESAPENLRSICFETAHKVYGDVLPEVVEKRLIRELDSIIGNGYAVVYYISHLLVKKSNEDGYIVGSRGSVGSSFVATMSGITEVNPLIPHYVCPKCQHSIWIEDGSVTSGYDLENKDCPKCGSLMRCDGQDIPFETFLGFEGDKVPDIDLNFSGDYQEHAHLFTKEVFGEDFVYRAGTIGTVANKTAFGYIKGYCDEMNITDMNNAYREYLAGKCEGVKRTTGQHPGGIIVIPSYMDVYDFTPVQFPANNPESTWKTTHFDFHDIHDNVLKLDILGHVDPTVMRLLYNISGIDPTTIPMNDEKAMSVFSSIKELHADERIYNEVTGAVGLPEFGTQFVRGILELTKPKKFSELVSISGLSHGTDVWNNNAKDLVEQGHSLSEVIGCRDDIMIELIQYGLKPKDAFTIMESVRKGKGLKDDWIKIMKENNVPDWYIESCQKIKYMFPKAHAVAYVIMAVRIAWFKVYHPEFYYVAFFSLRCDAYEIETMTQDAETIRRRMSEIQLLSKTNQATNKDKKIYDTLEVCLEMVARGYRLHNIDIKRSLATEFKVDENDNHVIIPPFVIVDGLGENVAKSIIEAREAQEFISKEDLVKRTSLSTTLLKKLVDLHVLDDLDDSNQLSLF